PTGWSARVSPVRLTARPPDRRLLESLPPFHPLLDVLLESELGRLVPFLSPQRVGQIVLGNVPVFGGVRVLVPHPVSQLLHEPGGSVPDVQRHGFCRMLVGGLQRAPICRVYAVRFRGGRE